jgi:hypothetical protein
MEERNGREEEMRGRDERKRGEEERRGREERKRGRGKEMKHYLHNCSTLNRVSDSFQGFVR